MGGAMIWVMGDELSRGWWAGVMKDASWWAMSGRWIKIKAIEWAIDQPDHEMREDGTALKESTIQKKYDRSTAHHHSPPGGFAHILVQRSSPISSPVAWSIAHPQNPSPSSAHHPNTFRSCGGRVGEEDVGGAEFYLEDRTWIADITSSIAQAMNQAKNVSWAKNLAQN